MEPPVPDFVSADGRFRVAWESNPFLGNALVNQPRVTRDGRLLLDLWGPETFDHHADVVACDGAVLTLRVTLTGRDGGCTVVIDAHAGTYALRDAARGGRRLDPLRRRLAAAGLSEEP